MFAVDETWKPLVDQGLCSNLQKAIQANLEGQLVKLDRGLGLDNEKGLHFWLDESLIELEHLLELLLVLQRISPMKASGMEETLGLWRSFHIHLLSGLPAEVARRPVATNRANHCAFLVRT